MDAILSLQMLRSEEPAENRKLVEECERQEWVMIIET